jgi:hypothetical protein
VLVSDWKSGKFHVHRSVAFGIRIGREFASRAQNPIEASFDPRVPIGHSIWGLNACSPAACCFVSNLMSWGFRGRTPVLGQRPVLVPL